MRFYWVFPVLVGVLLPLVPDFALGQKLTQVEVQDLLVQTARVFDLPYTVAVTNREGTVLGVFQKNGAPLMTDSLTNFRELQPSADVAVNLARTASFFSNNQAPLSSRTVRFISGIHFPPGIMNTPNAALYGIENTNRGCFLSNDYLPGKELPRPLSLDGSNGIGIQTGKPDVFNSIPHPTRVNPGGVPIYRNPGSQEVIGGIGVAGFPGLDDQTAQRFAEFAAVIGIASAGRDVFPIPNPLPPPGEVFIDGIRLPFVGASREEQGGIVSGIRPFGSPGPDNSDLAGLGAFAVPAIDSPTDRAPEGWLVLPRDGMALSADEVHQIIFNSFQRANQTRAAIRLTPGQPCKMVIAVGDLDGSILGLYRMVDATIFSVDVAVTKARNVVYFSGPTLDPLDTPGIPIGTAVSARTLSFGAQPLFPAGIGGQPTNDNFAGPFFNSLFVRDVAMPCTQGRDPNNLANQSGIVFFPGSTPLYRNGDLIGGLGVSGDGVEQDDFVTEAGLRGFDPDPAIRADQVFIDGVRMPYFKFPRNPTTGVLTDFSLPRVLYSRILPPTAKGAEGPLIEIEVAAGEEMDLPATLSTIQVFQVTGGGDVSLAVTPSSPFFNYIRIPLPLGLVGGETIRVDFQGIDVLGQSSTFSLTFTVPAAAPKGDFNFDGTVNGQDLVRFCAQWREDTKDLLFDLDGDLQVTDEDLFVFCRNWATTEH